MTKKAKKKTTKKRTSVGRNFLLEEIFHELASDQIRAKNLAIELFKALDMAGHRLDKLAEQMRRK